MNDKKKSLKKNKLNKENSILKEKITNLENKNLRLLADYDNLRKRKNEEISDLLKFSGENLIKNLLTIFDDLGRILDESDKSDNIFYSGIKIMNDKLHKILSDYNISQFDSLGDVFNSDLHNAMVAQESKKKKNIIIQEIKKGYKYNDKVIRHSEVIVSKGK